MIEIRKCICIIECDSDSKISTQNTLGTGGGIASFIYTKGSLYNYINEINGEETEEYKLVYTGLERTKYNLISRAFSTAAFNKYFVDIMDHRNNKIDLILGI